MRSVLQRDRRSKRRDKEFTISIGNLEMSSGEMSPLHESALFQPRSINDGDGNRSPPRIRTVFTCKKCGSTDMEEEKDVKNREETDRPDPGKSNENRSSSRMSSRGSSSSSPCTNVSDDDDDINVVDDDEAQVEDKPPVPSSSSMSICEQLESMVTR